MESCNFTNLNIQTAAVDKPIEMETTSPCTETTELHSPLDTNVCLSTNQVTPTQSDPPTHKTYSTRIWTAVQ